MLGTALPSTKPVENVRAYEGHRELSFHIMRRAVILLVSLLVAVGHRAADDPIQRALEHMQPTQVRDCAVAPHYVILERRPTRRPQTIAALLLKDSECTTELGIFRVMPRGILRRLATYDGEPRRLELRDVTGNGVPEILVSLWPANRSTPVVILHWDGNRLKAIGETTDTATYVDLDHDGVPEIVTQGCCATNECGVVIGESSVQRLRDGRFVDGAPPTLAAIIVTSKTINGPETVIGMPYLPNNFARRCRIRMINGTRGGRQRATSVTLRSRQVKDEQVEHGPGKDVPIRMTAADEYVEAIVDLPSRCTLFDIMLDGPASATVAIIVETTEVRPE